MRFMVTASWPVEAGNAAARAGTLGDTVEAILEETKPEAVYFTADHGKRTTFMILDVADASEISAIAEPWFLAFNASIDFQPVMLPDDLAKAGPAIESAVKKYG